MHTLGPWQYDVNHNATEAIIVDWEGYTVVELHALENSTSSSDLEHNARLIAAAPNLFLALNQMLREHDALVIANALGKADGSTEDLFSCANEVRRLLDRLTD